MKKTKEKIKKQKVRKHKKKNIKMFPFYKMISWDLLFYYPIIFLFLTQVKGFSASQVLFADAFYTLSNTVWQIPVARMVEKLGKKNSLIIGNLLYTFTILAMIFMHDYYELLIIQFFYALGYSIKGICETNILYDSLPAYKKRGKLFSKIDGKAASNFFYFDAIASVIAGFTFAINGYIPMILCFVSCLLATIMSMKFKHTTIAENKVESVSFKEYMGQLKDSFNFFRKSNRIKMLLIYNALFMGIIMGIVNLRSSMLEEMLFPEQYFGIIFAILQFIAGITSRYQLQIQGKFRNKTLTVFGIPVVLSCILIGFIGKDALSSSSVILIFLLYLIQYAVKGPYHGLMTRYLTNFTNRKIRPKITAFKNLSANLVTAIITLICGLLLNITTTSNTFIIVGCLATIAMVLTLDSMRGKVGLKPEYYTKEDVRYSINKPILKEKKIK